MTDGTCIDATRLRRLRWRARRGLLENDLLLERFFARHGERLCEQDAAALDRLLDLTDKDLLDLILERGEPSPLADDAQVRRVLAMLRAA